MRNLIFIILLFYGNYRMHAQQMFARAMPFYNQLSSNEIVDVYQDSEGYIWIGTTQGLDRYDGYDLQSFKSDYHCPERLLHNAITCLSDEERFVWIGTQQGVNLYEKSSGRIYSFPDQDLIGKNVRFLTADRNGFMWVAVGEKLYKCNAQLSIVGRYDFSQFTGLGSSAGLVINSVYPDREGAIWVLTWQGGLFRYLAEKDTFESFPCIGTANNPFCMYQDVAGHYWIATWGDGLWSFFPEKREGQHYMKNEIINPRSGSPEPIFFSIAQDNVCEYLWVLSYNELYVLKSSSSGHLEPVDLHLPVDPYKMYTKILKDRCGNFWLGSYDGGYTLFFGDTTIQNYPIPLLKTQLGRDPNIVALCPDNTGIMWLYQDRYGLFLYDPISDRYGHTDREWVSNVDFHTLIQSRNKEGVWVGNKLEPHVWRLIHEQLKIKKVEIFELNLLFPDPGNILQIAEDAEGNLWVLTTTNLFVKLADNQWITYCSETKPPVRINLDEKAGGIWAVFAKNRISFLSCQSGIIQSVEKGVISLFENERVVHLITDGKGRLWLTTNLGRICRSNSDKINFRSISLYSFANTSILNVLSNPNYLWFITNNQLLRYDIHQEKSKTYSTSQGNLTVSIFRNQASSMDNRGVLYAGGHGGFISIQPEEPLLSTEINTSPVITDVRVDNQSLFFPIDSLRSKTKQTLQHINLLSSDQNIEIRFSSLNYIPGQEIRFAYQLEGTDKDWIYLDKGNHSAFYNHIPKGEWSFWLKCTDELGRWGNPTLLLTVHRRPALYETWFAYLIFILAGGLFVYGFLYLSLRRIRKKNAVKLQDEIIQTKLNYFTTISHELLTPLTVISCATDALEISSPASQKVINSLRSNVGRLKRLLQQVLDFRKIEHGKMSLKVSYGNVGTFILDMCETYFAPIAQKKKIILQTRIEESELWGYLDFGKLDQILYNLLSNAIKYTADGHNVWVSVSSEIYESQRFLIVRIKDEGIGIAASELESIFEQFYSNQNAYRAETNGIGLFLTKALVTLHRGNIRVESEIGKGSCFILELPLDKNAYPKEEVFRNSSIESVSEIFTPFEQENKKSSLLLADDNPELLGLMKQIFVLRYEVFIANDGIQAWNLLETHPIDLIVSDVMMPGKNGLDLCRSIKGDIRFSHIPVIMLTAKNGMNDRIACYEAGADGYVTKPFETNVLRARIDNLIKSYQARQVLFQKNKLMDLEELKCNAADQHFLESIVKSIEIHLPETDFDLERLSEDLHLSKSTLYRKVKGLTGLTPLDFVKNVKLKRACEMLKSSGLTISEIAYAVGFTTPKYFSKCFKEEFGITPSEFQQRNSSSVYESE